MIDSHELPHPLLAARGLAVTRMAEPIFGPLDLHLFAGEVLLIEGGNGSGKTTLLRVLAGLLSASSGEIERHGVVSAALDAPIGFLSHATGLRADLSPLEQLDFFACLPPCSVLVSPDSSTCRCAASRPVSASVVHLLPCCIPRVPCGCWMNPTQIWTAMARFLSTACWKRISRVAGRQSLPRTG